LPMPFAVVLVPRHSSLPSMAYTNSFRDPSSTQRMHKTPLLGPSSAMRRGQCPPHHDVHATGDPTADGGVSSMRGTLGASGFKTAAVPPLWRKAACAAQPEITSPP
jgi:hypothetical protein